MRTGSHLLREYPLPTVQIDCERCGRAGRYRVEGMVARFGAGAALPDVLMALASCERRSDFSRPCGARLDAYRRMLTSTSMRRRITSL